MDEQTSGFVEPCLFNPPCKHPKIKSFFSFVTTWLMMINSRIIFIMKSAEVTWIISQASHH